MTLVKTIWTYSNFSLQKWHKKVEFNHKKEKEKKNHKQEAPKQKSARNNTINNMQDSNIISRPSQQKHETALDVRVSCVQ